MENLLTVKDVAHMLKTSTSYVYELVRLNEMPYKRLGRLIRFKEADIEKWLDSGSSFGGEKERAKQTVRSSVSSDIRIKWDSRFKKLRATAG